jgi:hypothetical protein
VSPAFFGAFVLLTFVVPVPILAWLMYAGHFATGLALWPNAQFHLGLGLWTLLPMGWWWIELGFIALCCGYYFVKARGSQSFGARAGRACAVVVLLHVLNAPWLRR